MKKILIKDKIKQIENSKDLNGIPIQYLPEVIESDYLFISYSHNDYKKVYVDLLLLEECGLKFWYDLEMAAGTNWEIFAFRHMAPFQCKGVIFYVSESLLKSDSCIKELEYAKKFNKPIITINLPFESDYVYEGESVKGKIFAASQMLSIMKVNGVNIPEFEERKTKIEEYFPDKVIYLPFTIGADKRYKQIREKLKEIPLLEFNERKTHIIRLNDSNVLEVTKNDLIGDEQGELIVTKSLFSNCQHLKRVDFGGRELYYDAFSFSKCSNLISIKNQSDKQTYVLEGAFYECERLEEFKSSSGGTLTNDCLLIGESAFKGCESLKKITIDCELKSIPKESFANCHSLNDVSFINQDSLETIGDNAFYMCVSLDKIIIPQNAISIGKESFAGCSNLSELKLSNNLVSIDDYAFIVCESLVNITLPKSLKVINYNVFDGCKSLKYNEYGNALYLPSEDNPYFALIKIIDKTSNRIDIHNDCRIVAGGAFENCSNLEQIYIPKNVVSIGKKAFKSCVNLSYVQIGEVGFKAFKNSDKNMAKIIIGEEAFADCTYFMGYALGTTQVSKIGDRAFANCENLNEFDIAQDVTEVGKQVFDGCERLKVITYHGTPSDFIAINVDKDNDVLYAVDFIFEPHDLIYTYGKVPAWVAFALNLPVAILGLVICSLAIWFENKMYSSMYIALLVFGFILATIAGIFVMLYSLLKGILKWRKAKWSKVFANYKKEVLKR